MNVSTTVFSHGKPQLPLHNRCLRTNATRGYYLGIDFGTSGARCTLINDEKEIVDESRQEYSEVLGGVTSVEAWRQALFGLLGGLSSGHLSSLRGIAIDGTSSTALLVDRYNGSPMTEPKMYNEAQSGDIVDVVMNMAPKDHTVVASTSTLCKAVSFLRFLSENNIPIESAALLHQCDWLSYLLHRNRIGVTDWNNALKLGFDPETESYPSWIVSDKSSVYDIVPKDVYQPGAPIARLDASIASTYGVNPECWVCAGTTDSVAAFLAADVKEPGEAVTSLGSTLAIKMLSSNRVDNASFGVYSHRLGSSWLVGGASNTGGAVLKRLFTDAQLQELTHQMDPDTSTGLEYVVLPKKGERFPYNDPNMEPCMEPRPENDAVFLQGLLESMSRTEATAYEILVKLGSSPVKHIYTAGGGAKNQVWTVLRQRACGVPVEPAEHGEASYGAALLCLRGLSDMRSHDVHWNKHSSMG